MKRKVFVRSHNRKWPKRWDLRRFIVEVNDEHYIVLARGLHDAETIFRSDYHVRKDEVIRVTSFSVDKFFSLFSDNQILNLKERQ